jgi:hypothetical protein
MPKRTLRAGLDVVRNKFGGKMHGIEFKSGINDCYFNCEGKCVNKNVTRIKTRMSCDWDSKQNCTFTQIGTELCDAYKKQSFIEYPDLQRTTANICKG